MLSCADEVDKVECVRMRVVRFECVRMRVVR